MRDAIIKRIKAVMPDTVVYEEKQEQGLVLPCFFVLEINTSQVAGGGPDLRGYSIASRAQNVHYTRTCLCEVRYHLEDGDPEQRAKHAEMANILADILTEINEDDVFMFGNNINWNIVNDVLIVQATYVFRVVRPKREKPTQQDLVIEEKLKE